MALRLGTTPAVTLPGTKRLETHFRRAAELGAVAEISLLAKPLPGTSLQPSPQCRNGLRGLEVPSSNLGAPIDGKRVRASSGRCGGLGWAVRLGLPCGLVVAPRHGCRHRLDRHMIRHRSEFSRGQFAAWILIVIILPVLGTILYFVLGRKAAV